MTDRATASDVGDAIGPAIIPQPFWTSKGFWSGVSAEGLAIYYMASTGHWDPVLIVSNLMIILGVVFRWTADQPLTVKGGTKL